jgi:hypothetical protein
MKKKTDFPSNFQPNLFAMTKELKLKSFSVPSLMERKRARAKKE